MRLKTRDFLTFREGPPKTGQVFYGMCVNDFDSGTWTLIQDPNAFSITSAAATGGTSHKSKKALGLLCYRVQILEQLSHGWVGGNFLLLNKLLRTGTKQNL